MACNFIKKETVVRVFSWVLWNFYEHLFHKTSLVASSVPQKEDRELKDRNDGIVEKWDQDSRTRDLGTLGPETLDQGSL